MGTKPARTVEPVPFNPEKMAATAYFAMVARASEVQQRILQRKALIAEFGHDAIPVNAMHHSKRTLLNAREHHERAEAQDRAYLVETMPLIRSLEALFEEDNAHNVDAFVAWMRERAEKGS